MKKLLIAAICGVLSLGASAQIIRSTSSERIVTVKKETQKPVSESWNHSGWFFNTGIGVLAGDLDTDFAWEVGTGYRLHIASGISWEVFRFGFNTGVSNFADILDMRFTTGIRYDTPRIKVLGNRPIYANFVCGYGFVPELEEGGFVYEIGLGAKLSKHCSLGLIWQGNNATWEDDWYEYSADWGMFGAKIEYQF